MRPTIVMVAWDSYHSGGVVLGSKKKTSSGAPSPSTSRCADPRGVVFINMDSLPCSAPRSQSSSRLPLSVSANATSAERPGQSIGPKRS